MDAMVNETEGQVLFGVRQAFLGAILANDYVQVYREAVATAELNVEMVQKMYDQGVVSEYERLRAEVELANLKPQLIQAENQVKIANHNLKNMIGLDLNDEVELVYDFNPDWSSQQLNLEHLSSLADEHRPSLRESRYYVEMRKKAIGVAKAGYRPQISLRSNLDWTRQSDEFDLSTSDWTRSISASLRVSMPIFDGFATSAEVKKAKLDHVSSTLEASRTQNQVELELQEAFLTYEETSDRLGAQSKTVTQAEEGLRIARLRYEQGVGTQLEVLSAEAALTLAKTNYVQATHDAAVAVYRLLQVTGVDNVDELREQ
jgi:outer membrane protein TolC